MKREKLSIMTDRKLMKGGRSRETSGSDNSPVKKKLMMEKGPATTVLPMDTSTAGKTRAQVPVQRPDGAGPGRGVEPEQETEAPGWFKKFEVRQEARFDEILKECHEAHASMKFEIDNLKDEVAKLTKALEETDIKLDDLENRNRRNNIVLYNVPEKLEGGDCAGFVQSPLQEARPGTEAAQKPAGIQRAHRTGLESSGNKTRPRPIHVGFSTYLEKEKCRRVLLDLFKRKKFGKEEVRLFVSDDFSQKVRKMRKEKIPELMRLRKEGKIAYLAYPATIRVRNPRPQASRAP